MKTSGKKRHSHTVWTPERHAACARASTLDELLKVGLSMFQDGRHLKMSFRMIIGPMTTGGFGFEKNMFIFRAAVALLEELGQTEGFLVFNQVHFQDAMVRILGLDRSRVDEVGKTVPYPHELIDDFYAPIFGCAEFEIVHPLPRSEESTGTTRELALCERHGLQVAPFPDHLYDKAFADMVAKFGQ